MPTPAAPRAPARGTQTTPARAGAQTTPVAPARAAQAPARVEARGTTWAGAGTAQSAGARPAPEPAMSLQEWAARPIHQHIAPEVLQTQFERFGHLSPHPYHGGFDDRIPVFGTAADFAALQRPVDSTRYRSVVLQPGEQAPGRDRAGILLGGTTVDAPRWTGFGSQGNWTRLNPAAGDVVGQGWGFGGRGGGTPSISELVRDRGMTVEQALGHQRSGAASAPDGGGGRADQAGVGTARRGAGGIPQTIVDYMQQARQTMLPAMQADTDAALRQLAARAEQRGTWFSGMQNEAERQAARDIEAEYARNAFSQAMSMAGFGLEEQQQRWNQMAGDRAFGLDQFRAQAPYMMLTEHERQMLPYQWAGLMGLMPGSNLGALRQVSGGRITTGPGGATMTLNGRMIDEATAGAMGGYFANGVFYLPENIARLYLGVR